MCRRWHFVKLAVSKLSWTSLLVSSSDWYSDLLLILLDSFKIPRNNETAMLSEGRHLQKKKFLLGHSALCVHASIFPMCRVCQVHGDRTHSGDRKLVWSRFRWPVGSYAAVHMLQFAAVAAIAAVVGLKTLELGICCNLQLCSYCSYAVVQMLQFAAV